MHQYTFSLTRRQDNDGSQNAGRVLARTEHLIFAPSIEDAYELACLYHRGACEKKRKPGSWWELSEVVELS